MGKMTINITSANTMQVQKKGKRLTVSFFKLENRTISLYLIVFILLISCIHDDNHWGPNYFIILDFLIKTLPSTVSFTRRCQWNSSPAALLLQSCSKHSVQPCPPWLYCPGMNQKGLQPLVPIDSTNTPLACWAMPRLLLWSDLLNG